MIGEVVKEVVVDGWFVTLINQYWKLMTIIAGFTYHSIRMHFRVSALEKQVIKNDDKIDDIGKKIDRIYLILINRQG